MIRTTVTPNKKNISIDVPEDYIGKQVEILLYATDELKELSHPKKTGSLRGTLNLTEEQYKDFQQYTKDIRGEWERDI